MDRLDISLNKGVRRTPSFAENGELSECVGLYPKNGELRNLPVMTTLKDGQGTNDFVLPEGCRLLAVHATGGKRIYISRKTTSGSTPVTTLYYSIWEDGTIWASAYIDGFTTDESVKILTLGRIMMALDEGGLHYFFWNNDTATYTSLGNKLPTLEMQFGLQGEIVTSTLMGEVNGHFDMSSVPDMNPSTNFLEEDGGGHIRNFETQAYAKAAEITATGARDGYFTHPFFVRYALRLYDETRTAISAPVLMMVSTNEMFMESSNWHSSTTDIYFSMIRAKLDYFIKQNTLDAFEPWKDLIKGVDIYVTAPIYNYKADSNKIHAFFFPSSYVTFSPSNINSQIDSYGFTVSKLTNINSSWSGLFQNGSYVKRDMMLCHAVSFAQNAGNPSKMAAVSGSSNGWNAIFRLESKDSSLLAEDYKGEGPYYLLRSYDLSELTQNARTLVDIPTNRLTNITTQTILKETETFDNITSVSDALLYNRRLALSDITENVVCRQSLFSLLPFADAWQGWSCSDSTGYPVKNNADWQTASNYHLTVEMQDMGGSAIRVTDTALASSGTALNIRSALLYMSYLSLDVTKLIVYRYTTSSTPVPFGISLPGLKKNILFDGTYYKGSGPLSDSDLTTLDASGLTPTENHSKSYPSRMLLSEVENPFVYLLRNQYEIGAGSVLRLAALTEPLSTGQFGQFPVVAFCSDGMYALEVKKEDGTLHDPAPMSPDILSNLESVTSVEGGILYITKQGLKFLGINKQIRLLSGTLEGKNVDEDVFVGSSSAIRPYVSAWAGLFVADTAEVREALQSAKVAYDNKNGLIHLFFQNHDKHSVLSLDGFEFVSQVNGTGLTGMPSVVQDYAGDILQFSSQKLYVFDSTPRQTKDYGFCLSRILTFGEADMYANIMQMKVYHDADTVSGGAQVKTALYVSNDKIHWALLPSLKGASYKYYRFALFTYMTDLDGVSGISMLYKTERTNKLR